MANLRIGLCMLLLFTLLIPSFSAAQPAAPAGSSVVPEVMVNQVSDYIFQGTKLYYLYAPYCAPILNNTQGPPITTQVVGRTAVQGAIPRTLFTATHDVYCQTSVPDIVSNIASDENYVYWVSRVMGGLVRLSENALVGATPELVASYPANHTELGLIGSFIYVFDRTNTGPGITRINKTTGESSQLLTSTQLGPSVSTFKTDGEYLYWLSYVDFSTGLALKRYQLATQAISTIATNVNQAYVPYAGTYVYIGFDNEIRRYSHSTGTTTTVYTSSTAAYFLSIAADATQLYFVQQQVCTPSCFNANGVYRYALSGGNAMPLYLAPTEPTYRLSELKLQGQWLFFRRNQELLRLPANAGSVALSNIRITGIEVNQAIQSDTQSVPLIRGKRTAVRVYVQSDGVAVDGVMAHLYRVNNAGVPIAGPLIPYSRSSWPNYLRVSTAPNKDNIDHSFVFFLPNDWIDDAALRLRADLNPHHFPPEPSYADNSQFTSVLAMQESGRLENHFVLFGYESGGDLHYPRLEEDVLQALSWVRRAYPISSAPGWFNDSSRGFRPKLRWLFHNDLGGNVDGTDRDADCQERIDDGEDDIANLCAAWYVVCPTLDTIRSVEGLSSAIFQYGMVSDGGGFPRGWACGLGTSGPAGSGAWGWDFDGSYADWYTAHEMGHALGRAHPTPAGDDPATDATEGCGHSRSDSSFPWPGAAIGNATLRGFDVGDRGLNPLLTPQVYPSSVWRDMMSYCNNQWISDYTYNGIKNRIPMALTMAEQPRGVAGPYLQVNGVLFADTAQLDVSQVRYWDSLAFTPPAPDAAGLYEIRLLDAADSLLASYRFTPEASEHATAQTMSEWVPFVAGTAHIEIAPFGSTDALWSFTPSTHVPQIDAVQVQVNGDSLNVQWSASDADGDSLTYMVLYSADGGATWETVQLGLDTPQTSIDTATLAGSSDARIKVLAYDGFHQAESTSNPLTVMAQAPLLAVTSPADGNRSAYGELVYFAADVYDLQDGSLPAGSIEWRMQDATLLGTGAAFDSTTLPIGEHVITVTATNSAGLSSSQQFTIIVDDELALPGPTLSAAPTHISWHVGEDVTAVQMAQLGLSNVSSVDEFSVSVSESAPWLTATLDNTTTPATVQLSADPAFLVPNTATSTQLAITGTSAGTTQTLVVPVSFAKGFISNPTALTSSTYLPLVMR